MSSLTELVICRGLPASGKTTWAREWVAQDVEHRVRVNRDDLRLMVDEGVYIKGVTEARIIALRDAMIIQALEAGISVVSDDTNLSARTVKQLAKLAVRCCRKHHEVTFRAQDFTHVPVQTCISLDRTREAMVGSEVILGMYDRYLKAKPLPLPFPALSDLWNDGKGMGVVEPYLPAPGLPKALLVDVDGTLALANGRDPFDEHLVINDEPNWPVINCVLEHVANGYEIVIMSGRTEGCRTDTERWLAKYLRAWTELHMRDVGDNRKDAIVKREKFDQHVRDRYNIRFVLDDRQQVVDMWRQMGLTVFQVAPGDF